MRAALYLRVSTADQAERYSLPAQERRLVEFCEAHDPPWTYTIFRDGGISGETLDARPDMQRLLQDVREGKFDVVIGVEMERFSRSTDLFDWLVIRKVMRQAGVRFGTPAQLFDPNDAEDAFLTVLFGALSTREKEKLVERTTRARIEAARRGCYVAGLAPFGYRHGPNATLVVYEPEAEVVRHIFRLLAAGSSIHAIVRDLNGRAIPTPKRATRWRRGTVHKILRNAAYNGCAYYRQMRIEHRPGKPRVVRWRDRKDWIAVPVPRIVDEATFRGTDAQLRRNAVESRRNVKRFYLLRGLVRCGICGHTMIGKCVGRGRFYYTCVQSDQHDRGLTPRCRWHAIPASPLEALVWDQVVLTLRQPDVVRAEARRHLDSRLSQRDQIQIQLDALHQALACLPAERDRVQTLYREGYATIDEVRGHLDRIERKRKTLDEERRTLAMMLDAQTADLDRDAQLERIVARAGRRLEHLSDAERQEVVRAVIDRVQIGHGQTVEIRGYVAVDPTETPPGAYVQTAWARSPLDGSELSIASLTSGRTARAS
jgi:site-specific DNA recombinase